MPEPTGGLRFDDILIRVAEYLGVAEYGATGGGAAAIPTDPHDLDLCKRLTNDGIRMFLSDNPKWYWTRKLYSLTVSNLVVPERIKSDDPSRYFMPQDLNGDTMGPWTYGPDQNVWPEIETITENIIRQWRSIHAGNQEGIPRYAAFRKTPDRDVPAGQRGRWEVLFYPDPGEPYDLEIVYRHYFNDLIDPVRDFSPAGAEHDETIVAAAIAKAELDRDDTMGARMEYYQKCLGNSIKVDLLAAPKTVGANLDGSSIPFIFNRRQLGYSRPVLPANYQTQ